jgi:hypothetical protein
MRAAGRNGARGLSAPVQTGASAGPLLAQIGGKQQAENPCRHDPYRPTLEAFVHANCLSGSRSECNAAKRNSTNPFLTNAVPARFSWRGTREKHLEGRSWNPRQKSTAQRRLNRSDKQPRLRVSTRNKNFSIWPANGANSPSQLRMKVRNN